MDYAHHPNTQQESYIEYVTPLGKGEIFHIKQNAFSMMKQLEGWCSFEKASILIDLILKTRPEVIVEIGVFGGKSLIPMAYALKVLGKGKAYGIDPWDKEESIRGIEAYPIDTEWWENLDHLKIMHSLMEKIKEFEIEEQIGLIRNTSFGTPAIEGIDILHIDGNHSDEVSYNDVVKWVPLVKKGGWIILDDILSVKKNTTERAYEWLNTHCVKFAEFTDPSIWENPGEFG